MDKVIDNLFIFPGEGIVDIFAGNYSDYHEKTGRNKSEKTPYLNEKKPVKTKSKKEDEKKLSYKEKIEFEKLDQEIIKLEGEKENLEEVLNSGTLNHELLKEKSERFGKLLNELEIKSDRWLKLSERAEG